jgi:hypothetical protein
MYDEIVLCITTSPTRDGPVLIIMVLAPCLTTGFELFPEAPVSLGLHRWTIQKTEALDYDLGLFPSVFKWCILISNGHSKFGCFKLGQSKETSRVW